MDVGVENEVESYGIPEPGGAVRGTPRARELRRSIRKRMAKVAAATMTRSANARAISLLGVETRPMMKNAKTYGIPPVSHAQLYPCR